MLTIALSVSYAVASLATILMPYTRRMLYARGRILQRAADGVVVALAFVAFALAVLTAYYGMIAVAACIFILSASLNRRGQYREALSLSAAGYSTIALFWWRHDVGAASLVAYALGVFAVYRFAVWRPELAINSRRKFSIACVSLAAGAICITAGNIGGILNKEMFEITRLHWGVYLSAGELLREGARPFYDFPLQYGLGPATLVGAFCIAECWSTAHSMFAAVSALYALVIAATAVVATSSSDRSLPMTVTVLLACTLATGLFIGWPPLAATPVMVPATGGLRYLPLAVLVLYVVLREEYFRGRAAGPGHVLWVLGLCWSPEAAFHVTFVWWPYYLWAIGLFRTRRIRHAVIPVLFIVAFGLGVVLCLIALYVAIFRVLPDPEMFAAYVLYPPYARVAGLTVNVNGPIVFAVFAIVSASLAIVHPAQAPATVGKLYVTSLAAMSVLSYYVGSAHDNAVLHFVPFFVLMLSIVWAQTARPVLARSAAMGLSGLIALAPFFGWNAWKELPARQLLALPGSDVANLLSSAPRTRDTAGAGAAVARSWSNTGDPTAGDAAVAFVLEAKCERLLKLDPPGFWAPVGRPWAAVHDIAAVVPLPDRIIVKSVLRTAERLKQPGWLVFPDASDSAGQLKRWTAVLNAAYDETTEVNFGQYRAIRFTPRAGAAGRRDCSD